MEVFSLTYHEVGVLDGSLVHHRAEEVFTDRQDHELLKEAISEHKLLRGARDITVVVQNTHARETSNLYLKGHVLAQIDVDLSLFCGEGSRIVCTLLPDGLEALVSNLINHVR